MLTINKEFRKGILFVRLLGVLNSNTVGYLSNEITSLVKDIEISNVVFNISGLQFVDITGVNEILKIYQLCKKNNGISLLCGINSKVKDYIDSSMMNIMVDTKDEISAINMIKI